MRRPLERDDLTVLDYRFEGDRFCTAQRFAAYAQALGSRFIGNVLPAEAATPDAAGEPTIAARDEILSFDQ
jgi:hypothetical protein